MRIYVDSDNRTGGDSHDFTFYIRDLELANSNLLKYVEFSLLTAAIPKSFYYINSSDVLYIYEETSPAAPIEYSVVMPTGNYTLIQWITVLNQQLAALSLLAIPPVYNYSVSYAASNTVQNGKLTFSITGYDPLTTTSTLLTESRQMARATGLELNVPEEFQTGTLVMPNIIQLTYESLLIHCSLKQSSATNDDVIALVNTQNTPDYAYIFYNNWSYEVYDTILGGSVVPRFYITDVDNNAVFLNGIQTNYVIDLKLRDDTQKNYMSYMLKIGSKFEKWLKLQASQFNAGELDELANVTGASKANA